jgi:uncharacterized protein (TIGR02466 family)
MADIVLQDAFKTGILFKELNIDLKNLSNFCYFNNTKTRQLSNVGGIQSDSLDINLPIFFDLKNNIIEMANNIGKEIFNFNKELILTNLWFNINKGKDSNIAHMHAFCVLSGVFYVNADENCGDLVVLNPFNVTSFIKKKYFNNSNPYNSTDFSIPPKNNLLVMFPSWLVHYVKPNLSNTDRISFAFDLTFKD